MNKAICKAYGIDCEAGISRFLNDEAFFAQMLAMFLGDDTFARMKEAYAARDLNALFRHAHELKGVSGNAALTVLYEADRCLVDSLRPGADNTPEQIDALFAATAAAYERTCEGIRLALG